MKFKARVVYNGKIWPAVRLDGLSDELYSILDIVESIYQAHGIEPICSAGTEDLREDINGGCVKSIHSLSSLHPRGYALDFSTFGIDKEIIKIIESDLIASLSCHCLENNFKGRYNVINEPDKTHFHIQFKKFK